MSAKKRLLIGWRWPGGLGGDKTTHSPPFFPGRSLRKRRRRRRGRRRRRRRRRGSGKGAEEEEVEDLGRLCKTRPDKDCPINTQVPARTTAFSLSCCCSQLFPRPKHFSLDQLDFSPRPRIGHYCPQTDSALDSDFSSACYFVVGPGCVNHEGGDDQTPPRSSSSSLAFSTSLPLFLHLCGKSPLALRSSSTARPHWLRKVEISAAIGLPPLSGALSSFVWWFKPNHCRKILPR